MVEKYVVFDRDGTLIEHVHHLVNLNQVKVKSDAFNALFKLKECGFKLGIITNQSVIGRGLASLEQIKEINNFISNLFKINDIIFEFILICPHTFENKCQCRKPKIALGKLAIDQFGLLPERSYYVGDQQSDVQFGKNLGCTPVQIRGNAKKSKIASYYSNSLMDAVTWIINDYLRRTSHEFDK